MTSATRYYTPRRLLNNTPEGLQRYLYEEMGYIASAMDRLRSNLTFDTLAVAPTRPVAGLVVRADGTNWDPGSGAGLYEYDGTNWNFLGGAATGGTSPVSAFLLMGA